MLVRTVGFDGHGAQRQHCSNPLPTILQELGCQNPDVAGSMAVACRLKVAMSHFEICFFNSSNEQSR